MVCLPKHFQIKRIWASFGSGLPTEALPNEENRTSFDSGLPTETLPNEENRASFGSGLPNETLPNEENRASFGCGLPTETFPNEENRASFGSGWPNYRNTSKINEENRVSIGSGLPTETLPNEQNRASFGSGLPHSAVKTLPNENTLTFTDYGILSIWAAFGEDSDNITRVRSFNWKVSAINRPRSVSKNLGHFQRISDISKRTNRPRSVYWSGPPVDIILGLGHFERIRLCAPYPPTISIGQLTSSFQWKHLGAGGAR